ncbi:MAG: Uncharacterized protein FD166_190 [Bacteroidetes bacterium]|nr:MAG: Uncharacterized protein FD166_190 [Bacteroidota bacterium]
MNFKINFKTKKMKDNFIKALIDQKESRTGTKINIHFPLRGDISNYCIELNREIQRLTKSSIDFSPKSFQIPHLTLYSGFVTNENNFNSILNEIYELAQEMNPIEITPTRPILVKPKKNYIFIHTDQSNQINELKRDLKDRISKWIQPLGWDIISEAPHISIAYINNNYEEIEEFLEEYHIGSNWYGDSIEVSYSGPWGSCLGSIRAFEFP